MFACLKLHRRNKLAIRPVRSAYQILNGKCLYGEMKCDFLLIIAMWWCANSMHNNNNNVWIPKIALHYVKLYIQDSHAWVYRAHVLHFSCTFSNSKYLVLDIVRDSKLNAKHLVSGNRIPFISNVLVIDVFSFPLIAISNFNWYRNFVSCCIPILWKIIQTLNHFDYKDILHSEWE